MPAAEVAGLGELVGPRREDGVGVKFGRRISIRQLIGLLLVVAVVVAGLLFRVTTLQLDNASERRDAQLDRVDDLALGDEVSTSATDLSRMAQLYVATGDERFRRYHQEILDIRAGKSPRPAGYDADFWDEVIAEGQGRRRVRRAGRRWSTSPAPRTLTPEELRRLELAIGHLRPARRASSAESMGAVARRTPAASRTVARAAAG